MAYCMLCAQADADVRLLLGAGLLPAPPELSSKRKGKLMVLQAMS